MSTRIIDEKSPPETTHREDLNKEIRWNSVIRPSEYLRSPERLGPLADSLCLPFNEKIVSQDDRWKISHTAYELVSNAVKFSDPADAPVRIEASIDGRAFHIRVTNRTSTAQWERFREKIMALESGPLDDLFVKRVHAIADRGQFGGLGLILLKKNDSITFRPRIYRSGDACMVEVACDVALNR